MAAAADKSLLSEQEAALYRMRHSCAHLLAAAVQSLWPEAKFGVGPAVKFGFYYDILLPTPLGPPELQKIEKRMRELRNKKHPFIRQELQIDEAIAEMARRGQQFKVELLTLLKEKGAKSIVLMCLVAAPEGIKLVNEEHPDVEIYVASVDEKLDDHGYIVPGLGDAGDRIFGTL